MQEDMNTGETRGDEPDSNGTEFSSTDDEPVQTKAHSLDESVALSQKQGSATSETSSEMPSGRKTLRPWSVFDTPAGEHSLPGDTLSDPSACLPLAPASETARVVVEQEEKTVKASDCVGHKAKAVSPQVPDVSDAKEVDAREENSTARDAAPRDHVDHVDGGTTVPLQQTVSAASASSHPESTAVSEEGGEVVAVPVAEEVDSVISGVVHRSVRRVQQSRRRRVPSGTNEVETPPASVKPVKPVKPARKKPSAKKNRALLPSPPEGNAGNGAAKTPAKIVSKKRVEKKKESSKKKESPDAAPAVDSQEATSQKSASVEATPVDVVPSVSGGRNDKNSENSAGKTKEENGRVAQEPANGTISRRVERTVGRSSRRRLRSQGQNSRPVGHVKNPAKSATPGAPSARKESGSVKPTPPEKPAREVNRARKETGGQNEGAKWKFVARAGNKDKIDDRSRSQMLIHVEDDRIQVSVLEGRTVVEHYVSDRHTQSIAGNIYLGKVQNVLPGMEAAFVDIGTPKNAVLYAGDVRFVAEEFDGPHPRIEDILDIGQSVLVQVVKDPMGSKGARLTTEVSLPGRFLVLLPESDSTGISRRLPETERERLRDILRRIRPEGYGVIVRTAAEDTTEEQLKVDLERLEDLWQEVYRTATKANPPVLVYEEPELFIRTVREFFTADFRRLVVNDKAVHKQIVSYLEAYESQLVDRVEYYDATEDIPLFQRYHVIDQIKTGLGRKIWLPSGGSLVFDFSEALTVIDVNTSKNVGKSSLEETVFQNNLEAAEEIAKQLRLRDIGGIIVIDFIDMEVKKNREAVLSAFKDAIARDKTKTQVYDISELGLVEMTRKNVSEGLLEAFSHKCESCEGRGILVEEEFR